MTVHNIHNFDCQLCDLTHEIIFFGIFICPHCLPQYQSKGVKVKSLTAFEVV